MNFGCSCFSWETDDGKHLLGRTYDQPGNLAGNRIAMLPSGFSMQTSTNPSNTTRVSLRHALIGMAVIGLETPILVDGVNTHGLMGALLHYPGYAFYDTRHTSVNLHPGFLIGYLLGQCASIAEIMQLLPTINLTSEKVFGQEMPVHYIFSDRTGEAMILEPDAAGFSVHRHSLGVLTNSPNYDWQRTNLRNYIDVTNQYRPSQHIINDTFCGFSETAGSGFGLPGDYSSPSRFVRLALCKHFAIRGRNETQGISKIFHNLAPVDIPEGLLGTHSNAYMQTLSMSAICAESQTYYFATAENRRICAIHLQPNCTEPIYFDLPASQDICYLNENI